VHQPLIVTHGQSYSPRSTPPAQVIIDGAYG